VLFVWIVFKRKNVPRGSFLGEAKKQVQGLLPIDSRLITNILSNPIHSNENVLIPSNHVPKEKKKTWKLIYYNVMCLIQAQLLQSIQPTSFLICNLSQGYLLSL
jgi:hypothetical protein